MRKSVFYCRECFKIADKGIIVFLRHQELGIERGTILMSEKTNQKWELDSRILCDHAINIHKIFENESLNYMRISFNNQTKKDISLKQIKQEEANCTYQYFIKPLDHDSKPIEGEELIIEGKIIQIEISK